VKRRYVLLDASVAAAKCLKLASATLGGAVLTVTVVLLDLLEPTVTNSPAVKMARGAFTEYAMEQITAPVTRDLLMIHLGHVQSRCVQRPVLTEAVARRWGSFLFAHALDS